MFHCLHSLPGTPVAFVKCQQTLPGICCCHRLSADAARCILLSQTVSRRWYLFAVVRDHQQTLLFVGCCHRLSADVAICRLLSQTVSRRRKLYAIVTDCQQMLSVVYCCHRLPADVTIACCCHRLLADVIRCKLLPQTVNRRYQVYAVVSE